MTVVRGLGEVRRDCRTDPDEAMASVVLGLGMRYPLCCRAGARGPCTAAAQMRNANGAAKRTWRKIYTYRVAGSRSRSRPMSYVPCSVGNCARAPAQWTVQLNPGLANAVTLVTTLRSEHLHTPQHFFRKAACPTRDPEKKMKRARTVGLIASDCV